MSARVPAFVVRQAGRTDLAAVVALEEELFGADAWSAPAVAEALAEVVGAGRHVLAAEVDHRVAGYAVLRVAGDVADLERIAVAPAHRRTGLATALLAGVRDLARQAGAQRLLLEVSEANAGARAFYGASAARELDRRRRYYRDGSDALVLQLPLHRSPDPVEVGRG